MDKCRVEFICVCYAKKFSTLVYLHICYNYKQRNIYVHKNFTFFTYARGLNIAGDSAKVDIIVPGACIDGTATFKGNKVSRNVFGMGDIKTRLAFNIFGTPATSPKNFKTYE